MQACSVVANSLQHYGLLQSQGLQPTRAPSVHGIFQVRILEQVVLSSSRNPPDPGIEPTCISRIGRWILTTCTTWETLYVFFITIKK